MPTVSPPAPFDAPPALLECGRLFASWLRDKALPMWATEGQAADGAFAETLTADGALSSAPRRTRVQARQIYVYAKAGMQGWDGPWREVVQRGLDRLFTDYLRPDGRCRTLLTPDGAPADERAALYDQAFVLLALATARLAGLDADDRLQARAVTLRAALLAEALPQGGFEEIGPHPFQANAHMHLLEACLAWEEADGDAGWRDMADDIVRLARRAFVDPGGGFLREFFDADWRPAPGDDGRLVEPGHQFEWAWLLIRYGRARNDGEMAGIAAGLYRFGLKGVSDAPRIALDELTDDGRVRSGRARLWPQTEWMKAALILAETADGATRTALVADAVAARGALWSYFTPQGLWNDKRLPQGGFLDEPAPASSLYHIMAAFDQLAAVTGLNLA